MKLEQQKYKTAKTVFIKTVLITAYALVLIAIGWLTAAYLGGAVR